MTAQRQAAHFHEEISPHSSSTTSMNKNLKNVVYALFAGCFGGCGPANTQRSTGRKKKNCLDHTGLLMEGTNGLDVQMAL
jgi:hypothetical protein